MKSIINTMREVGIVPVIKLTSSDRAEALGKALLEGGLPIAEITFRSDAAEESIRILRERCPGLLVGAGTVRTTDQVDRALGAGAQFIVTPGFNPPVVDYCIGLSAPIIPGTDSPSLVEVAASRGLSVLKFFPAEVRGGAAYLKSIAPVYPEISFMPTGGVNPENLKGYLNLKTVVACGGSWMVPSELIDRGEFSRISELCAQAVALARTARGGVL